MILGLVVYVLCAALMIGIGISQIKSKKPVGFYSGEKPPCAEFLSDVDEWNKKHGMMWIIYGIVIILSWCIGAMIGDSIWCVLPMCGGLIVPVGVMVWYHHRLIRKYVKGY